MTIAKMEKIQILAHREVRDRLVERVQELGLLHITDVRGGVTATHHPDLLSEKEVSDEGLERRLSQIQSTLDFLSNLGQKKGLLAGLVSSRIILTPQQYETVVEEYDESATVSRCRELDRERTELLSALTRLEGVIQQLSPWLALDCPLEEVASTEHTAISLGTLPAEALGEFHKKSFDMADDMVVETVHHDRERAYLLICSHKAIFHEVLDLLKRLGFEEASFPEIRGKPQDVYKQTQNRIDETLRRIREIEQDSRQYLREQQNLQILFDHLNGQLQRRRIVDHFGQTEKVSVIEGWIPACRMKSLEGTLNQSFDALVVLPTDPSSGEAPPIFLENSRAFVRPFEVVTELYGMPNAREYDPSPLLAPFFFVFFGLCITDAAYGVIITLMFLYLMKKFRVTLGRVKLVGLLFFGGISTILMGAMTGGWFGDLANYLPPWLDGLQRMRQSLMLFDPMEQVLVFIGIALVLGFTQICCGLVIRMVRKIRQGELAEAFCGPFPWLTLLNGLVIFGLSKMGVVPPFLGDVGKWGAVSSALAIVLLTDRQSSNWFARIAWGVYGLYGITSYVGDVLSYLRLFALGLATGIIAMVVNLLADMISGAPYIGWFLFAIVFLVGHVFNILINGLGAFVHTLRLQYVEFFPKFFEGGGRPYRPFLKEARYTIVADEGQRVKP
jgi:V/A-type H+-transporting ATPase subunit I